MPKNGWKYRTEQFNALDTDSQIEFMRIRKVSAKFARWIYERAESGNDIRIWALRSIADDESAPWAYTFLWRELIANKSNDFGDWVLIAMGSNFSSRPGQEERLMELYFDEEAHPMTRGSAIFGINYKYSCKGPVCDAVRELCRHALWNEQNPYARAGGAWLGQSIGGFEERIAELANDQSPTGDGSTVASYCV